MCAPTRRAFLFAAAGLPWGVLSLGASDPRAGAAVGSPRGHWEKLPCPPGRVDYIRDVALDERDVLWVMSSSSVTYWDGQQYQVPEGTDWEAGELQLGFFGGPDRGVFYSSVFTTRPRTDEGGRYGEVYRAGDGRVDRVAGFHYDLTHSNPSFFISASGRLFHWGKGYLAFHTGTAWERIEAEVKPGSVRIVEAAGQVRFVGSGGKLITIGQAGGPITQGALEPGMDLWAQSQTVAKIRSGEYLWDSDVETPSGVDVSLVNTCARRYGGARSFPNWDGTVWLAVSMRPPGLVFLRVELDGSVSRIEHTAGLLHGYPHPLRATSLLSTADGCLWAGLSMGGAVRLRADDRYLFDGRTGLSLPAPELEDSRGRLYSGLYVFHPHRPEERRRSSRVRRPALLETVWKWRPEPRRDVQHAWRIGPWAVLLPRSPFSQTLVILDAKTGQRVGEKHIDTNGCSQVWAVAGNRPDEMLFVYPNHVLAIDLPGATIREKTEYPLYFRVPPTPIGDQYLVANRANLALIDRSGKEVWTHRCRDSIRPGPLAVFGPLVVAQAQSETTLGIDLHTGEQLWSDRTEAWRGSGAAFADDARYLVEANTWVSPRVAEGGILARQSRTGRPLWQRRKPGMISHAPVVDRKRDHVLAVFDRGNVVCLAGKDGSQVWETWLPENPHPAAGQAHPVPYWPAISIQDDRLWVVDRDYVLHALDLDEGRFDASVALTTALSSDGTLPIPANMVAMPWRADNVLVVATPLGTAGYRIPEALHARVG